MLVEFNMSLTLLGLIMHTKGRQLFSKIPSLGFRKKCYEGFRACWVQIWPSFVLSAIIHCFMNCIFNLNLIRSADLSAFNNDSFKKFKQPTATDPSLFIPEIPDPDLTCIFGFQHSISRIKAKQVRFVNISCTLNQYLGLARLRC